MYLTVSKPAVTVCTYYVFDRLQTSGYCMYVLCTCSFPSQRLLYVRIMYLALSKPAVTVCTYYVLGPLVTVCTYYVFAPFQTSGYCMYVLCTWPFPNQRLLYVRIMYLALSKPAVIVCTYYELGPFQANGYCMYVLCIWPFPSQRLLYVHIMYLVLWLLYVRIMYLPLSKPAVTVWESLSQGSRRVPIGTIFPIIQSTVPRIQQNWMKITNNK
jgi:hypothetical protein